MSGGERLSAALPRPAHRGVENGDSGTADAPLIKGKPPIYLLAGLAHEVVRRIAYRERDPNALPQGPAAGAVDALCTALISDDGGVQAQTIIRDLTKNTSTEVIYLQYLAAAARMLGDWWIEDRVAFAEVTTATGRIFELLRNMTVADDRVSDPGELTVVFASVPGEQHTLGIRMAADLFRGDGWEIALKIGLTKKELIAEIEALPRCIIGLSVSGQHSLDGLADLVEALHKYCPHAAIVVCGHDIEELRPRLSEMGLQGVARGIIEAKEQISALWDRETARYALTSKGRRKGRC